MSEESTNVNPSYMFVIGQKELTLHFPQFDYDPKVYVRAKPTLLEEDDIAQAAFALQWEQKAMPANRQERRQARKKGISGEEALQMKASLSPGYAFVAKCIAQITDYQLPVREAGREDVQYRTYNGRNNGDNEANKEIYKNLLQPGAEAFRDLIEQFLDYVAGRGTEAQEDFEAFLAEQPRVLGGM